MSFINNGSINMTLPKTADERKLRDLSNQSGLLLIEETFTQQLQTLYDEEVEEEGGGYYRELIPYLVQAVFEKAPEVGFGKEIYNELVNKLKLGRA
jgi:hypothetical protein